VTVTDFEFKIEQSVPPCAAQWTVADEEPAYRGRMSREVGLPGDGDITKADRSTIKRFKAWRAVRQRRGLPPWVGPDDDVPSRTSAVQRSHSMNVLKSSWTLRQWADDYCQSRKIFKEFVYEKVRTDLFRPARLKLNEALVGGMDCFRSSTDGTSPHWSRQFEASSNQRVIMVIASKLVSSRSTGP
jgi:hypothetical protein